MAILARIPNAVHLLVAKRAAQERGIMSLINSAQSGQPLPAPLARSTPTLYNKTSHMSRYEEEDDDDDDDDGDDGAVFGSRVSLGNGVSQKQSQHSVSNILIGWIKWAQIGKTNAYFLQIYRPKSLDGYSNNQQTQQPKIRESEISSLEESTDDGSDEVWQPTERTMKSNSKLAVRSPSPLENHSFQPSPVRFSDIEFY